MVFYKSYFSFYDFFIKYQLKLLNIIKQRETALRN